MRSAWLGTDTDWTRTTMKGVSANGRMTITAGEAEGTPNLLNADKGEANERGRGLRRQCQL